MVQRTYPQARTHQPADPTAADSQGLIFAWHGGRLLQDSVRGAPLSTVGYAGMGRTDRGVGPSLNGSSGSINTQLKFTAAEGSIALLTYLPSAISGSTCMAVQTYDDAGSGVGLGWQNGAARIRGGFDIAYSGSVFPAGLHLFEIDWNASMFTAYLDGASVGSNSLTGGSRRAAKGAYYFEIGCFSYSGGRLFFSTQTPLLFAAWNRTRTAREHERMWRKPWEIFRPAQRRVPVSAGGAADLTLADASHAHAADSLSLTTASTLTIADATHAHTAEALSLTTASTLAVADALHDHAAEGLALTTESLLALQDALHDHAADAPELLSGSSLLIAEALQAHTADGLALVVDAYLTVANAGHGHTADALVLTVPSTEPPASRGAGAFGIGGGRRRRRYDEDEDEALLLMRLI